MDNGPEAAPLRRESENRRLREILSILARRGLAHGVTPEKLRLLLEDLGPTFVKLGQIMSMRSDLLPRAYCQELVRLRADASPLPFSDIETAVEAAYGKPLSAVFSAFDPTPVGSASIAQVHAATLPTGERVVVKVRRPGIRETMSQDIALLRRAGGLFKLTEFADVVDLNMVLDEMDAIAQEEMDFLTEAKHTRAFRRDLEPLVYADCPRVYGALCTDGVLVMEYIDGIPLDHMARLRAAGYDLNEIGEKLAECYVRQVVDTGFFHADPHPGNLRVRGGQIIWLDMGMMGTLTERDMRLFREAVQAVANQDVEKLKDIVLMMGVYTARIDEIRLKDDISAFLNRYGELSLGGMDLGKLLDEMTMMARSHRISMPGGMTMLGRGVMTLEGLLAALSPDINVMRIMARHLSGQLLRDFDLNREAGHYARSLYNSASKALDLPAQASDALYLFGRGQTRLNVSWSADEVGTGLVNQTVRRLSLALVGAGALMGGAMLLARGGASVTSWQNSVGMVLLLLGGLCGLSAAWPGWPRRLIKRKRPR